MKKFGFGKKSDSNSSSPAPQDANPYAQQPAEDPYAANATPYQQARAGLPSGPRGGGGLPRGPAPRSSAAGAPPPPYTPDAGSQQNSSGYGSEKYGASGGYGANRYDNGAGDYGASSNSGYGSRPGPAPGSQYGSGSQPASRRTGGYGGLGNDDEMQSALFSGARDRAAQRQNDWGSGQTSGASGASGAGGGSYGGYGEQRIRTAEEQEEDDIQDQKAQINAVRDDSIQSLQRSLQHANRAEETIRSTLARLGQQDDMLYNTEKNLDLAANQNKIAAEKTRELKTLNGSMFAVHVANPFTSKQRKAAADQEVLDKHRLERDTREATRRGQFSSTQHMEETFKGMESAPKQLGLQRRTADERSKFTFEDDDGEQEEKEQQIDEYEEKLGQAVGRLKFGAMAAGQVIERQIDHINRLKDKSDRVDDDVRMNRNKMDKIR